MSLSVLSVKKTIIVLRVQKKNILNMNFIYGNKTECVACYLLRTSNSRRFWQSLFSDIMLRPSLAPVNIVGFVSIGSSDKKIWWKVSLNVDFRLLNTTDEGIYSWISD